MTIQVNKKGSTRKSIDGKMDDVSSTIQSSCQDIKKRLLGLIETLDEDDIVDENDSNIVNTIVERAESIAVLEQHNSLMKKHIDDEILVVRKEQEEERANSEATEDKPLKSKEGEAHACEFDATKRRKLDASAVKKTVEKIKDLTEQGMHEFNAKSNDFVKKVKIAVGARGEDDDDVIIQGGKGLSEQDVTCPYSRATFTDPCSNHSRKPCNHHMDRASVEAFAAAQPVPKKGKSSSQNKNPEFNCPVPGCEGRWTLATSQSDDVFLRKVQKYLRRKAELGDQSLSAQKRKKNSVVIEDEAQRGDAEYTLM